MDKKSAAAAQSGLYLLIIAAIVIVANALSAGVYKRIDVTKNERHTLSQGSGRLIQGLDGTLTVEAYVTRGQAELNTFVQNLTELLKQYEANGGGKFKFSIIEPKNEDERKKAKDAGLQEMPFLATGDDSAEITQGYMGLVFSYKKEKLVIPQLQPGQLSGLEFWITNKIREIRDKAEDKKHRIGVVTDKDELKLSDKNLVPRRGQQQSPSIQAVMSQALPFYTFEDVKLADGPIDKDLVGIIVTQPRKDYTDAELRRIDEFLMRGGKSLVVIASAVTMKPNDATMATQLKLHNLDKLLEGYGIKMNKDAVFDHEGQFRVPIMTATGVGTLGHPAIVHVVDEPDQDEGEKYLDTGFAAFFRMPEVALPYPSSLELLPDKQPSAKVRAVARTTADATVVTTDSVDMKLVGRDQPFSEEGEAKQRIIAAVVEGDLKPSMGSGDGIEISGTGKDSRVLVISSSQFITNPFAYAGNGPELGGQFQMFGGVGGDQQLQMIAGPYAQRYLTTTILSLKNTFDWMSGDADLLAASAKLIGDANLSYKDASLKKIKGSDSDEDKEKKANFNKDAKDRLQTNVSATLTLVLPFFFVAFGLIRWRARESRKKGLRL